MKHLLTAIIAAVTITATAQNSEPSRQVFSLDVSRSADNYAAYQAPTAPLTAAPRGYRPVYISHYGRHGSRQLIGRGVYERPLSALRKAQADGQLTARGRQLLSALEKTADYARGREDELTPLGHQQHREIAGRMYDRFPEVFSGKVTVKANSSVVIRCILSMQNALTTLKGRNPQLEIVSDASYKDMPYIAGGPDSLLRSQRYAEGSAARKALDDFKQRHTNYEHFMRTVFATDGYWRDSLQDAAGLFGQVWQISADMQSTPLAPELQLYDFFTADELYDMWARRNAQWYLESGPAPQNGGLQPTCQRPLLSKIIAEADSALSLPRPGATLRFGHEVCLMPLVCLMGLDGYDRQIASLDSLDAQGWRSYDIFPMASNVQLVFYKGRKASDAVLVKFLHNEREARLPQSVRPVSGPYYRWDDVREFLKSRL